jgi:hypothetical protein
LPVVAVIRVAEMVVMAMGLAVMVVLSNMMMAMMTILMAMIVRTTGWPVMMRMSAAMHLHSPLSDAQHG